MKRNYLAKIDESPKILTPIKLTKTDLKALTVTVAGHKFINIGALICPKCGYTSGAGSRIDIDEKLDFFLKFGCVHYQ